MAERTDVRALLECAANTVGDVHPPSVEQLRARVVRRSRLVRALAVTAAVLAVGGVTVGVSLTASRHRTTASRPSLPPATASAAPTAVGAQAFATYRWRHMPTAPIPVRDDPGAVWTGTQLFVWGGAIGDTPRNDGALYDPGTRRWTVLPRSPLAARVDPLVTVVGHAVIVWGDATGGSDGARFDLAAHTWSVLPRPPTGPTGASTLGQLVTVGTSAVLLRASGVGTSRHVTVDSYDAPTDRWHALPGLTTPANHGITSLTALADGSRLYLWPSWSHSVAAGSGTDTSFGLDAYRLTAGDPRWTSSPVRPTSGYSAAGAQVAGERVLFPQAARDCVGCSGPFVLDLEPALVDPAGRAVSLVPSGPLGHAGDAIFWTGGAVLSYDAHSQVGSSIAPGDTAVWSAATNAWTRLPSAPTPHDAGQSVVLWTGQTLLVWGIAADSGTRVATGGVEFGAP